MVEALSFSVIGLLWCCIPTFSFVPSFNFLSCLPWTGSRARGYSLLIQIMDLLLQGGTLFLLSTVSTAYWWKLVSDVVQAPYLVHMSPPSRSRYGDLTMADRTKSSISDNHKPTAMEDSVSGIPRLRLRQDCKHDRDPKSLLHHLISRQLCAFISIEISQ